MNEKYDLFKPGDYGFTHAANPVFCAIALEVFNIIEEENLLDNATKIGKFMTARLNELAETSTLIGQVRCPGLFIGVEFVKSKESKEPAHKEVRDFLKECLKRGVLLGRSGCGPYGNVVKIKPPLTITEEEAEKVMSVFEESLKVVEKGY